MNRAVLAQKMEEVVRSYREQMGKSGESSRFADIGVAATLGVEAIKAFFTGTELDKESLSNFKLYSDSFTEAMKTDDRSSASVALNQMEREINSIKQNRV